MHVIAVRPLTTRTQGQPMRNSLTNHSCYDTDLTEHILGILNSRFAYCRFAGAPAPPARKKSIHEYTTCLPYLQKYSNRVPTANRVSEFFQIIRKIRRV